MAEPVFIAPHFDDVALSCGATVAMRARSEKPVILTVFGGALEEPSTLSSFAAEQHAKWKLTDVQALDQRMSEDLCAAQALGDSVQTLRLPFLDAIYRSDFYAGDDQLFGDIPDDELFIVTEISDRLLDLKATEYFVPLAIGNHVDHQLVLRAGRLLAGAGRTVHGYEDLPYALIPGCEPRNLDTSESEVVTVAVDGEAFDRKWAAISCYGSQLPVIFRHFDDPREQFEDHARGAGRGQLAERFWPIQTGELSRKLG